MTEPLSTVIGANILDQLLGKAVGKAMDTALGGASKALKDARAELDKETAQRAARMTLIVQKAAEELHPPFRSSRWTPARTTARCSSIRPFWPTAVK